MGQLVARKSKKPAAWRKSLTIAVDDGICHQGHDGMLYSLPSRDIIADSVEYIAVNAHCADALICISTATRSPGEC